MKTKHTPGPWLAQPDPTPISKDDWCIGVDGGPVDCVATCSERDARLIAAAPELLEALLAIERVDGWKGWHHSYDEACEKARTAIAKATGNTH